MSAVRSNITPPLRLLLSGILISKHAVYPNWFVNAKYAESLKKENPAFHPYFKVIIVFYFALFASLR
jgi:hypothetical protein